MSETLTHARGTDSQVNPITGEGPGIKDILERRAAGELPDAPETETPKPDATSRPDDDAEAAAREVASLRTRAAEAENRAAEAERARALAEQQRNAAVQGAEDTGFTAITTALNAAMRERESLQTEMKTAGEAGDFGRVGELSAQLGEIGATIRDLNQGKQQFEQDRQARVNAPTRPTAPTITVGSDAERTILRSLGANSRESFLASRTPETRDFLYQHPEFFTDQSAFQRMSGADAIALGRGHQRDSKEYFDTIREVALGQTTQQPRNTPADRSVTPGAAPSREAQGPTGRRTSGGDVYVSPDDKKVAEWVGVDPVEYVQERDRLQQEGSWPYRRR